MARSTFAAVRTCKSTCAAAGRKKWHTTPTVTMADEAAADQTTIALRDRVRRAVYSISGISGDRVRSQPGAVLAYSPCATVPVRLIRSRAAQPTGTLPPRRRLNVVRVPDVARIHTCSCTQF